MTGSKWAAMALGGVAISASGGCAWLIGADWSSYGPGGGSGGAAGNPGSSIDTGTGAGGTGGSALGSGGAGGAGGAECSGDEVTCSDNTPLQCVDGSWKSGEVCVNKTCVDGQCEGQCGPGSRLCSNNRPQRCNERGQWENEAPCPVDSPLCNAGTCVAPPSCVGLEAKCGPAHDENCCATVDVSGGTFNRDNNTARVAIVSNFRLDRFEVTVGRFRRFVEAYPSSMPAEGAGAHPLIEGSGWNPVWIQRLFQDEAMLRSSIRCAENTAWTDGEDTNETLPMNCLTWYEAFAFCAWDGGRLPTEAEWNYAAAGGNEQRVYPWSNEPPDGTYAVYDCMGDGILPRECAFGDIQPVGSRSIRGDGKWGQADLSGNMWEWMFDSHAEYPADCTDCANASITGLRVLRGGGWLDGAPTLRSSIRKPGDHLYRYHYVGIRCARTP
ncbi:formylglycine-generating enzyme family protein [Sorangium sp. So ce1099]|uniref:formylglycine-generating enzyme family protein n=1 Tax=Sorangium sp. So ce1099 TaxID=3133331 RepID=UPI003F5F7CF1